MTMPQQPAVTLTGEERTTLETFVHRGKANARTLTRARIFLKSADGWNTATLAAAFEGCERIVTNVQRRFSHGGVEAILHEKVQQLLIPPSSPDQGTSGIVLASLVW
jgi:hypothetical protein